LLLYYCYLLYHNMYYTLTCTIRVSHPFGLPFGFTFFEDTLCSIMRYELRVTVLLVLVREQASLPGTLNKGTRGKDEGL
jgi:hypothetical protein